MTTARSLRLRLALSRRAAAHHPLFLLRRVGVALSAACAEGPPTAPAATRASAGSRGGLALVVSDAH